MLDRFRIARTLSVQLRDLGLCPTAVLRQAGLPIGLFEQPKIWVSTEERFALFSAIERISGDETVGLKLGSEERLELYDPVAITAVTSRTFRDALERIARYKQLTGPQRVQLKTRGSKCYVEFVWLRATHPEPFIVAETCFAWLFTIAQRGLGPEFQLSSLQLRRNEARVHLYERHFGCAVALGRSSSILCFESKYLDRPFVTHNPDLLETVAPQMEADLRQQLADSSLPIRVKGVIKTHLAGHRPRVEEVATDLRMSPRTLQRRLLGEGVSFSALLDDARDELARHYLSESALELTEIGYLLGYDDPNSFHRAFQKWEGTSPGRWRQRHGRPLEDNTNFTSTWATSAR